ncbi:MAG: hypothetical protein PHP37_01925 [Patescibacteria group bacterium]|nr:hypothetical protein [Patescibacteria group bacterium]
MKSFFKKNKKKIILFFIFIFSFLLVLIFFFKSIFGSWWTIYPQPLRSSIALNRLALMTYSDPLCRQDCSLQRAPYRQEIINSLNRENFSKKIEKIIYNEDDNIFWRLELLKTLSLAESFADHLLFSGLQNYLSQADGNLQIKKTIVLYWSDFIAEENLFTYIDSLKNILADDSFSLEDRILALSGLSSLNLNLADFYLGVLEIELDDALVVELLRSLGSDPDLLNLDKTKISLCLEKILRSLNSSFTSRRLAIFILADFLEQEKIAFGDLFLEEGGAKDFIDNNVNSSLIFYNLFYRLVSAGELDDFSRYLIIDIFNNYTSEPQSLPEITSSAWDYYYQN